MAELIRSLTETDRALLDSYKYKCREIKGFTLACLRGTHTGMLLFGAGGNGKSYSIRETLREQEIREVQPDDKVRDDEEDSPRVVRDNKTWVNHQGRITPKGLVQELSLFPESIHVVEDAETMFDDKNCWGVLRMALHSQDQSLHPKRRITWTVSTSKGSYDFFFSGALIIVGNRVLNDKMEEVEAVKTRCPSMNFEISNEELKSKMKEICISGYKDIATAPLSKDDCFNVLGFMLDAIDNDEDLKRDSRGKEKKLNLRLLVSGFRFMALGKLEPSINWKELLLSQMKQIVGATKRTRAERVRDEKALAQEVSGKKWKSQREKLLEWCRLTGRDTEWADKPEESDEYKKGFNAAKTDLSRKSK